MRHIRLDTLAIEENRQRKLFAEKPLDLLKASIVSKGLMHPPVVRLEESGTCTLIAGERRCKAIAALADEGIAITCDGQPVPLGHLPVILLSDLSPHGYKEAELEENTVRENLTWQEQAMAIAELHALRSGQAEAAGRTQTMTATATEILGSSSGLPAVGDQITRVTEAVILSKHLEDPDVLKAKTQKEAMKVLRKKAEATHRAKLAESFDQSSTPHTLAHGDALAKLAEMPSNHFNCILTDPPYGVDAHAFGGQAGTGHEYKDDWEYALRCYTTLATEGYRITKENAVLYAFCDIKRFPILEVEFMLAGWEVWPVPLIWAKTNGMLPRPHVGPRRTYEAIIMAIKGSPQYHKVGTPDVIICPQREEMAHGAQKPVELYAELLSRSTMPGDLVLDCFAGSGTIFPAATKAKVVAHGVEFSEEYYHIALTRMSEKPTTTILDEI